MKQINLKRWRWIKNRLALHVFIFVMLCPNALALKPLPVYSQTQLIQLFATNSHLKKVKEQDNCQLLQDIEAHAIRLHSPAFQFLYGDMLTWAVCVERDVEQGLHYIKLAAKQGLPAALEQLGRYYSNGVLVQKDKERALPYLREAAALGNLPATLQFAELLIADFGSPLDYEQAYRLLYQTISANQVTHRQIAKLRKQLEAKMPINIIQKAKKRATYW